MIAQRAGHIVLPAPLIHGDINMDRDERIDFWIVIACMIAGYGILITGMFQ